MGKRYLAAKPVNCARLRTALAPSNISHPVVAFSRLLLPFYFRFALRFTQIEVSHPERILQELQAFQNGKTRLIVAFRHAYGDEPQLVFHLFNNLLPRLARRHDFPLARRPILRIVHDYAVPLWGDALIRFILPRIGAVPVYHVKMDPASLKQIRRILSDGPNPLGLAPEGQISYHSETLPRIEQGTIRMGFWCAQDLEKAGRSEAVHVLPLSIHYQYDRRDAHKISKAIVRLEQICGISQMASDSRKNFSAWMTASLPRLLAIEDGILKQAEIFYEQTTRHLFLTEDLSGMPANEIRRSRWNAVKLAALDDAEQALGIQSASLDMIQRVYHIRQICWDRIVPACIPDQSPLESALADRMAGEAWYAMRHMELVDLMYYHDPDYLQHEKSDGISYNRMVEHVISLQDLATRLMGGNITNRPNVIRKKAFLVPAPSLDLSTRLPDYKTNAKETIRKMTNELDERFQDCIKEHLNET